MYFLRPRDMVVKLALVLQDVCNAQILARPAVCLDSNISGQFRRILLMLCKKLGILCKKLGFPSQKVLIEAAVAWILLLKPNFLANAPKFQSGSA